GLNDLAFDQRGNLYVTDTPKGIIWKVDPAGKATLWKEDPVLLPQTPVVPFPFSPGPGVNGIVVNTVKGVVNVLNTTLGGVVQIPIDAESGNAGPASVLVKDASMVGADGITMDVNGTFYVAVNSQNRIVRVTPDGKFSTVAEGGLLHIPSSLAFSPSGDQNTLYVCNFASPILLGNTQNAGLLKLNLTTKEVSPITYFNKEVLISHPRYSHHASVVMKWGHRTIYADPSVAPGQGVDAAAVFKGLPAPDLIVITHIHGDHFDTNALKAVVQPTTVILAPKSVFDLMPDSLKALTTVMANGDKLEKAGVGIEAVPSYNLDPKTAWHPKGRDNGYVLTLGGKRIYIPGDTEDVPEMRALKNIDVAFLPMNLPFTMNVESAANAVREFKPKIVYPFHYQSRKLTNGVFDLAAPLTSDAARFKELVGMDSGVEVRLRRWYEPLQMVDRLAADQGDIMIQPVRHATISMTWAGKRIYFDPAGGTDAFKGYPAGNLILVTHVHPDHFDTNTLALLKGTNTVIVAPQNVFTNMPASLQAITTVMTNGAAATLQGIPVEAVAMYNTTPGRVGHPKGLGNGYVINLGGKRIYVSGDTEDIPEMRALQNIDVAFICMSLPSNMDLKQAASAVRAFKPRTVYPYHMVTPPRGGAGAAFDGMAQDITRFKQMVGADLNVEVRSRPWYADYQ
ncbi:MAG: MBL fold metallo-hydrolase, partial [Verrucomicrobia bacterium]|nr:MBL fold metallo-hydrolase [Verrucomicrobiota bacterium]